MLPQIKDFLSADIDARLNDLISSLYIASNTAVDEEALVVALEATCVKIFVLTVEQTPQE